MSENFENKIDNAEENEDKKDVIPADNNDEITESNADVALPETEEDESFHYMPKLSPKQQRVLQIILGLFCGFLVWLCLGLGSIDTDNSLFRWLFLIVFVVIMIVKNQIEKRTGIMMHTFMKFFLIGLVVFLGVFLIYGASQGMFEQPFIQQQ